MNPCPIQSGGPSGYDVLPSAPIAPAAAGPDLALLLAPGFVQEGDRGGCNATQVDDNRSGPRRPPPLRLPSRLSRSTTPHTTIERRRSLQNSATPGRAQGRGVAD